MSKSQFEYWKHTQLTLDVVPGRGGMFSLENGEGVRSDPVAECLRMRRSARCGLRDGYKFTNTSRTVARAFPGC